MKKLRKIIAIAIVIALALSLTIPVMAATTSGLKTITEAEYNESDGRFVNASRWGNLWIRRNATITVLYYTVGNPAKLQVPTGEYDQIPVYGTKTIGYEKMPSGEYEQMITGYEERESGEYEEKWSGEYYKKLEGFVQAEPEKHSDDCSEQFKTWNSLSAPSGTDRLQCFKGWATGREYRCTGFVAAVIGNPGTLVPDLSKPIMEPDLSKPIMEPDPDKPIMGNDYSKPKMIDDPSKPINVEDKENIIGYINGAPKTNEVDNFTYHSVTVKGAWNWILGWFGWDLWKVPAGAIGMKIVGDENDWSVTDPTNPCDCDDEECPTCNPTPPPCDCGEVECEECNPTPPCCEDNDCCECKEACDCEVCEPPCEEDCDCCDDDGEGNRRRRHSRRGHSNRGGNRGRDRDRDRNECPEDCECPDCDPCECGECYCDYCACGECQDCDPCECGECAYCVGCELCHYSRKWYEKYGEGEIEHCGDCECCPAEELEEIPGIITGPGTTVTPATPEGEPEGEAQAPAAEGEAAPAAAVAAAGAAAAAGGAAAPAGEEEGEDEGEEEDAGFTVPDDNNTPLGGNLPGDGNAAGGNDGNGTADFVINDNSVPLAFFENNSPTWSLTNLLFAAAGVALAIMMGIRVLVKDRHEEEDGEKKHHRVILAFAIPVLAILGTLLFLLTQDMSLTMGIGDSFTLAQGALFAAGLLSYVFVSKKEKVEMNSVA